MVVAPVPVPVVDAPVEAPRPPSRPEYQSAPGSAWRWARWWPWLGLLGVLGLSSWLELAGLNQEGFGNTYYAAAVKSMLTSWRAFFFVSFDSAGFVTVDKPPLGLWLQALSAKVLGFNGVALLLPQALAGIATVGLVYWLVRRVYGPLWGLAAALVMALVPISAVTERNNTMDATLVLVLVLGAWAASRAAEQGSRRWLLLCGALVGLGFEIKMLQAYLVLPGFFLAYLLLAPRSWRGKLADLALATLALLAVSLCWSVAVDLTPAGLRPYVGSSGTNSELALALTYNGLGRVAQSMAALFPGLHLTALDLTNAPGPAPGIGNPGLLRLFSGVAAGQASWLLPLAIVGLLLAAWQVRPTRRPELRPGARRAVRVSLVVWGGWLVACLGYFSFARFFHLYYLTMFGPAVAALAAIGLAALWRAYRRGGAEALLLPAALVGSALVEAHLLSVAPAWQARLQPWLLGLGVLAALALLAVRFADVSRRWAAAALSLGLAALLIAPGVWAVTAIQDGQGGTWLPQAGPANIGFGGGPGFGGRGGQPGRGQTAQTGGGFPGFGFGGGGQGALTFAGQQWDSLNPALVQYLVQSQGAATYLVATPTSSYASVLELLTNQPVMALGGYQGWDQILTPAQLASLVQQGTVRFFLLGGGGAGGGGFQRGGGNGVGDQPTTGGLTQWVQAHCTAVPASTWQGTTPGGQQSSRGGFGGEPGQLYDCAGQ